MPADKDENPEPTHSTVSRLPEEALEKLHMARVRFFASTQLQSSHLSLLLCLTAEAMQSTMHLQLIDLL